MHGDPSRRAPQVSSGGGATSACESTAARQRAIEQKNGATRRIARHGSTLASRCGMGTSQRSRKSNRHCVDVKGEVEVAVRGGRNFSAAPSSEASAIRSGIGTFRRSVPGDNGVEKPITLNWRVRNVSNSRADRVLANGVCV